MTVNEADRLFAEFEGAALQHFEYLKKDYGFGDPEIGGEGIEGWVLFKNPTTAVRVMYEIGASPWVQLLRLKPGTRGTEGAEVSSLELLLVERAPALGGNEHGIGELSAQKLADIVAEKARMLKVFGEDVLKGDFHVFTRLAELAEENRQRREKDLLKGR